jgi:hypothetical protein
LKKVNYKIFCMPNDKTMKAYYGGRGGRYNIIKSRVHPRTGHEGPDRE